uniref:Uncharacterized protein n=1 Tax=Avena sativa TaxID=4498 RepID=A0ACD5ZHL4_AVESA
MEQQSSVAPTAPAGIRSEMAVTASCALLATLAVVCSDRRTSTSAAFRYAVCLALMLCYPAVSYTVGLTQSQPAGSSGRNNDLAVVWACYLLGCADCVFARSVDVDDQHQQPRAVVLVQATQVIYVLLLLLSYMASLDPRLRILLVLLWVLNCAKLGMRVWGALSARRHRALDADNWLISKYMAHEHVRSVWDFDPETMRGYRYVVAGEKDVQQQDVRAGYRLELTDELVTVDGVWRYEGSSSRILPSELKDLCLSFALFKLLRRRLGRGPVLHERDDVRSMVLVRRGLAAQGVPAGRRNGRVCFGRGAEPVRSLFSPALLRDPQLAGNNSTTTLDDIFITRCAVVAFMIMELFQYLAALSRLLSDGHKVKMLCRCVRKPSSSWQVVYERLLRMMCHATPRRRYWSDSVGQYSLVHVCLQNGGRSFSFLGTRTVPVPVTVKRAIHRLLRSEWLSDLKYGDRALQRNKLLFDFDWSTSRYPHGAVGSILIWHIATTICAAANKLDAGSSEVATTLSDYCAYLLSEAPELVTDAAYETQRLMAALRARIQQFLRHEGCRYEDDAFEKLPEFRARGLEGGYEEDILADGVKLSIQIMEEMPDEAARWDVVSQVWVELLLSAAPSDNVEAHVKRLATGGELITQLWALLTHAGIVDKPKKPNYTE